MTKNEKLTLWLSGGSLFIAACGLVYGILMGQSQARLQERVHAFESQQAVDSKRREIIKERPRLIGDSLFMGPTMARAFGGVGSSMNDLSFLESDVELAWENRSGEAVRIIGAFSIDTSVKEPVLRNLILNKPQSTRLASEIKMQGSISSLLPGGSFRQKCKSIIGHSRVFKHFMIIYENEYGDIFDSYHIKEFKGITPCTKSTDCGDRISTGTFKGGVDNGFKYYGDGLGDSLKFLYGKK